MCCVLWTRFFFLVALELLWFTASTDLLFVHHTSRLTHHACFFWKWNLLGFTCFWVCLVHSLSSLFALACLICWSRPPMPAFSRHPLKQSSHHLGARVCFFFASPRCNQLCSGSNNSRFTFTFLPSPCSLVQFASGGLCLRVVLRILGFLALISLIR